ncbi:hypothetical protein IEQ34_021387 [Dendrobium chrysotoxum]|uniref:GATA transcription factor n=1 Tax=Dendrobium chrysotoxum TaxID=161865 RepID=A0AAV7G4K7_DENCH|nr:hypothetical protein IEQ34_021387 [Dendrobium chrysotoxum]
MEGYCHAGTGQLVPEKQGKVGGDHCIVEELLDFSNEAEGDTEMAAEEDGGSEETGGNCSADSCANSFSGGGGASHTRFADELVCRSLADVGLSGDLCEPYEELAELEWLSKFVEDSFSSDEPHKQQLISGLKSTSSQPTHGTNSHFPTATAAAAAHEPPPFTTDAPVPGKARSKRARTAPCSWSSRLLLLSQSSEKKKSPSPDGRKCLHCAADKTPQWRTGPMGPKTLCNACGVRFKSGRLVPEYRPAASPTFVLSKHSNSHRKVLELRRQKETQDQQPQQFLTVHNRAAAAGDEFLIQHRLLEDGRRDF